MRHWEVVPPLIGAIAAGVITVVFWGYLVNYVTSRFGLSLGKVRPTFLSDITFRPPKNNAKVAVVVLESLRIDSLWLEFHKPSEKWRSWVTVRIAGPTLILQHQLTDGKSVNTSRPTFSSKESVLPNVLDPLGRLLRNSFLRMVLPLVDVRFDRLQGMLRDRDGRIVLSYEQEFISLIWRSDIHDDAHVPKEVAGIARPNLKIVLEASPFEIFAPASDVEERSQLLVADKTTITFSAHASVLGRLVRPRLDIAFSGISVASSELQSIFSNLACAAKGVRAAEGSLHSDVLLPPAADVPNALGALSKDEIQRALEVHIHQMQRKIWEVSSISPALNIVANRTTLTTENLSLFDPLQHDKKLAPLVMVTLEELSVQAGIQNTGQSEACPSKDLFLKSSLTGLYVDLCNLPFPDHATYQIFSAMKMKLDVVVPALETGNSGVKNTGDSSFSIEVDIEMPKLTTTDRLIMVLLESGRKGKSEPRKPRSLPSPRTTLEELAGRHVALESLFRLYRPACNVSIIDPTVAIQVTRYLMDGPTSDGAFLVASLDEVSLEIKTSETVSVESDLPGSFSAVQSELSLLGFQLAGARGAVEEVARGFPDFLDVLATVQNMHVLAQLAPPTTHNADTFNAHLNLSCTVGRTTLDFSRLPKNDRLDYFQLAARLSSLKPQSPKHMSASHQVPSTCDDGLILVTSYVQATAGPVGVLLVGEESDKALLLEIESILWQKSSHAGTTGRSPLALLHSSRLEINEICLRTLGSFEERPGGFSALRDQFLNGEHVDICLQARRIEFLSSGEGDGVDQPVPTLVTDEVLCNFSIRAFLVALKATVYTAKLFKLFANSSDKKPPVSHAPLGPSAPLVQVTIERFVADILLPENVELRLELDTADLKVDSHRRTVLGLASVIVEARRKDRKREYFQLCTLTRPTVEIMSIREEALLPKPRKRITLNIGDVAIFVPYAFKLSDIIENAINLQKAVKHLLKTERGIRTVPTTSSRGRTRVGKSSIPTVHVNLRTVVLRLEDDPFETVLSRNYLLGLEEQEGRSARDKAFQNKAAALRAVAEKKYGSIVAGARQAPEVEDAWWLLQEFNSRTWLERLKAAKATVHQTPALLTARFTNLSIVLMAPVLPAGTIEESLSIMDPTTPHRALYDELIPRNIKISLEELSLQIRDYNYPLVHIEEKGATSWTTEGLLIVVEQAMAPESHRSIKLPLNLPYGQHLVITRGVVPTKLYTSLITTINSSSTIQLCWGAATEPGIAEMMGVFDTFTKPNADPSVPIGWWDKLRLMVHGHHMVNVTGGGEVKFRVLGSSSPYFDGRRYFGTEGMTICMRDGVHIDINGCSTAGEDISIECGELAFALPSRKQVTVQSDAEDTITTLRGGVKISFGFDFFPEKQERHRKDKTPLQITRRTHTDIHLRAPEFCSSEQLKGWDSFRGFRTGNIHVTIKIESPRPFYASLPEPINSLSLTMETLARFFTFTQVYQSVLTSLPIRRGKLFNENGPGPSKQKLGRVIGSIRLITSIYPLLSGFAAEPREQNFGVGLRCRAEQMKVDMTFVQRLIRQRRPKEELLRRKSTVKWILSASEIELTEVEARAVAFGDIEEAQAEETQTGPEVVGTADESMEDVDWYLPADYVRDDGNCQIRMVPFAWAPRIIYFKRNDATTTQAHDILRAKRDIYSIQKSLFKSRMREIESSIRHYLEVQKGLEYRMAVFFDDSLRQQSQIIVEKMAVLHEKKVVIEKYIRSCQAKMDSADGANPVRGESRVPVSALFKHHFIVHNVNLLWKKDVRNMLFQMISLQQRRLAVKYCLSNTATRVMSQLVAAVAERRIGIDPMDFTPERPSDTPKAAAPRAAQNSTMEVLDMDASGAQALLAKLIDEVDSFFTVPNESDAEDEQVGDVESPRDTSAPAFAFGSKKAYVSSRDPESPDYVASNQTFESEYIVQLIHPQVNLEAESKEDATQLESVVVAAESMQLRSVLILDARASSSQTTDENSDRNEQIIKSRMILNVQDAQLFVARRADIEFAPEFDLDNIVMHRTGGHGSNTSTPWPVWVPIECLIDHSSHSGHLERVVERTFASFHRDVPNPLYLKGDTATNNPESTQMLHLNFPTFAISANALQYMVIHDVIENLLVYRDPVRGEHTEKLKKMLLVLEQMEDLRKVQETVIVLQQKIRQADAFLRCGTVLDAQPYSDEVIAARRLEILRHLAQYQDELIIIINALKAMQMLEEKRKSAAVSLQTLIRVDKMVWCMITDDDQPLCEWALDRAQFSWVQYEDQSSINTLHIDQLHLENHMAAQNSFKEVIAPYNPEKRDVDYTRHKMIRVYWREMAPVAGIKVVDHFEVNIFPLLIQVTYDMAKEIVYYLFPEKRAKATSKDGSSAPSTADDRSATKRFSRIESVDQLTVRSTRSSASEPSTMQSIRRQSGTSLEDIASVAGSSRRGSSASESEMSPHMHRKQLSKASASTSGHQRSTSEKSNAKDDSSKVSRRTSKVNELKQMQARASQNRSFIYIKMPGAQHCLSYRGSKEKNIEDLFMFAFKMPTLEFRNKTWTWLDFLDAVKKEALRAVLANTGALVREKLFQKRKPSTQLEQDLLAPHSREVKSSKSHLARGLFRSRKDPDKEKDQTRAEVQAGLEKSKRKAKDPSTEVLFDLGESD
ncbi:hypothetical protein HKX48_001596 [Thoreauomyces humboldtii]|nr:hypothetical protein HKX48_001596 [Thoreauomyces humboldtii]